LGTSGSVGSPAGNRRADPADPEWIHAANQQLVVTRGNRSMMAPESLHFY